MVLNTGIGVMMAWTAVMVTVIMVTLHGNIFQPGQLSVTAVMANVDTNYYNGV